MIDHDVRDPVGARTYRTVSGHIHRHVVQVDVGGHFATETRDTLTIAGSREVDGDAIIEGRQRAFVSHTGPMGAVIVARAIGVRAAFAWNHALLAIEHALAEHTATRIQSNRTRQIPTFRHRFMVHHAIGTAFFDCADVVVVFLALAVERGIILIASSKRNNQAGSCQSQGAQGFPHSSIHDQFVDLEERQNVPVTRMPRLDGQTTNEL